MWHEPQVPPSIFNESQANQGDPLSKAQRWRNSGTHPKYLGEPRQRSKSKNSNLTFIKVLKSKVHQKNHKYIIREDNYVFNETGDLLLQELIKIFGQSLGTKKLVHIFGRWDTRWPPKRLGWRQSWNFRPPLRSISSQHQTNRHSVRRWIKQETDVVV